jgi:two-component system cell cycle response regulator
MERHLKTLMADAERSGRSLSVLITDIDHFKRVNDTYGHDAGDLVLKEFASRLRRYTRGVDLACRLGGEEFLIIMQDTDKALARQMGERVRECVAGLAFQVGSGQEIRVTASVGLATWEGDGDTSEALFKRADNALYAAKRQGRNQVVADAA